jgi:hypothetical protein
MEMASEGPRLQNAVDRQHARANKPVIPVDTGLDPCLWELR